MTPTEQEIARLVAFHVRNRYRTPEEAHFTNEVGVWVNTRPNVPLTERQSAWLFDLLHRYRNHTDRRTGRCFLADLHRRECRNERCRVEMDRREQREWREKMQLALF